MQYLIDSSVLIEIIRGNTQLDDASTYFINSVVYAEVLYGYLYTGHTERQFTEQLSKLNIITLQVTAETASIYTRKKLYLNKQGMPIPDNDMFIAATCIEYKLRLLTLDFKHFKRVPDLKIQASIS